VRAFARGAAFLASVVLLAACLRAAPSGTRHPWTTQAELRWTEAEDIDNLNPLLTTEILVTDLSAMTQGYLVRPDASGTLVPSLALTVPTQANHLISRDGKTIVYKLRHGAVWHDGRAFTSADVAFSVATILDPRFNVANRIGFDDIARVDTPDPYSVIVHLKEPYSPFVSLFLTPHVGSGILPVHLLRGHDLNHATYNALPLGLGPFRYVKWSRGSEVELAAFDRWWGGRPKLRRILYRVIPDATAAVNQLRTHELDGFARIPNEEYPSAKAVPGTRTLDFPTTSFDHIDFNVQNPVLADRRVREALAHAIDRKTILEKIDRGSGVITCSPVPTASWAYAARTPCIAFDLAAANRLLDAAGWKMGRGGVREKAGRALRLTLVSTVGNLTRLEAAVLIQSAFAKIGVDLAYRRYPANQLFAHPDGILASGKFDLALYQWFWGVDPDLSDLYSCAAVSPRGQNEARYCNPQVDRLLHDAIVHYDHARRRADYVRVQEILAHDLPSIVLSGVVGHFTINSDFQNVNPGPTLILTTPARTAN